MKVTVRICLGKKVHLFACMCYIFIFLYTFILFAYYIFHITFQKGDLDLLGRALQLTERYVCSQGTVAKGMEALLIMLRKLAYPNRWSDMVPIFGRAQPELSAIFREVYILNALY